MAADQFVNLTGVQAIRTWADGKFALDADLDELDAEVQQLINKGGEPNVIETVKVNGAALVPVDKAVDVEVPTTVAELSDASDYALAANIPTDNQQLTNGAGYQTAAQVQSLIDSELEGITGIDFQVVAELPASGVKGTIYLVGTSSPYDEYIWLTTAGGTAYWEQIGSTDVDLSAYWTMTAGQSNSLTALTVAEINAVLNA